MCFSAFLVILENLSRINKAFYQLFELSVIYEDGQSIDEFHVNLHKKKLRTASFYLEAMWIESENEF